MLIGDLVFSFLFHDRIKAEFYSLIDERFLEYMHWNEISMSTNSLHMYISLLEWFVKRRFVINICIIGLDKQKFSA